MAEIRQLRAIFSSGLLPAAGRFEGHFALFEDDRIGFVEAGAAIGPLAERGIAGFRIARNAARRGTQVGFADGIADASVHGLEILAIDSQEQMYCELVAIASLHRLSANIRP